MSLVSRASLRQISALKRYSCGFDMRLRCCVGAHVFLKMCKLRNHLQFGRSTYLPASHRTKAVKPIIDNCAKVRSRRTINLVLFTNRPRCCARGHRNEKLVLKCDLDSKKCRELQKAHSFVAFSGCCLPRPVRRYGSTVRNEADGRIARSALKNSGLSRRHRCSSIEGSLAGKWLEL